MSFRHRPVALTVVLTALAGVPAALATPPGAGAAEASLAVFDGFAASQSVYIEPRANSIFALPAHQLVGATHAEINSQPRAQGYAATWGVPLAQNARGVGIPVDYYGQCYANYPGEPKVECGIPFSKDAAPSPPSDGPIGGSAFKAHAEASGSGGSPDATRASGITEAGGMTAGETFRISWSRSESSSFVKDGTLHAVTSSVAQGITIGEVLHIGSIEARAETVHAGSVSEATGSAATVMQNVTIGGAPVTIGPAGLIVQGQPIAQAPAPMAKPILDAMASHGMTIEPLPAPRLTRDEATGLIEAASDGFRVSLQSPSGDAKFEMVFGRALARAGAVRAVDDTPLDLSAGTGESIDNGAPAPADTAAQANSAAAPAATVSAPTPGALSGTARPAAAFTAFDPVSGSVAPVIPAAARPGGSSEEVPAAVEQSAAPVPARLTAQPARLAQDLSSRVDFAYGAMFAVVALGVVFGLGRRTRRFGETA